MGASHHCSATVITPKPSETVHSGLLARNEFFPPIEVIASHESRSRYMRERKSGLMLRGAGVLGMGTPVFFLCPLAAPGCEAIAMCRGQSRGYDRDHGLHLDARHAAGSQFPLGNTCHGKSSIPRIAELWCEK